MLIVIVGILLGLVILVQNPKGGGLASGFTGATKIGGVQRTADFLEKSTWYLGIALFVLCLLAAKFYQPSDGVSSDEMGDEVIVEPAPEEAGAPVMEEGAATTPGGDAAASPGGDAPVEPVNGSGAESTEGTPAQPAGN